MKVLRGKAGRATKLLSAIAKSMCGILGVVVLFCGAAGATPTITGFMVNGVASNTGPVGATLTIQGSGFGTSQGFSTATLNGIAVAGNGVRATSWTDTSIVVSIPSTASSGPVVVKVSGVSSNAMNFSVGALISAISATTAPAGSTVTITGAGFGTVAGTVSFGGATATTTSWTDASIQATVPNAAVAGLIIVSVSGQSSNGMAFTPTPVISSISPGSSITGTTVTITGTGFGSAPGSVTFNSIQAIVKTWGINSITARVPQSGALGANNVVVTSNGISSSAAGFTIIPTVSVWPTASAITFGQTLASSTLSGGTTAVPGSFAFTTPTTAPPAGNSLQSVTFTPTDTTNFFAVTGTVSVTVNKATPTITVLPTASNITFGQTLASSTLTGGTASVPGSFAFTTPSTAPAAGTVSESVTFTPTDATDFSPAIGTVSVIVLPQPTIARLSMTDGPPTMGIVITGTNFGDGTGASGVTIGGLPATVLNNSWTDTSIKVQVPNAAVGATQVVVTNNTGGSSPGSAFTVDLPFSCTIP